MSQAERRDVIVAGAGVAGLSAAVALAQAGARVTLLERRPYIGGRAYSYEHPALEETIDSQHVVLGCCTNILDLARQAGMADTIRWYDEMVFLEPNGNRSFLRPGSLPAPMHQTMSFLRAPMLDLADKTAIASGLLRFLRGYPADDSESFASWLKRTGQTERAIRHFWEPVVVGALNDTFERCSVKYAGKVFHESFLRSPEAGRLGIPAAPLTEFFSPIISLAERHGVDLRMKTGVEALHQIPDGRWSVQVADASYTADSVVLATDFKQTRSLLSSLESSEEERARLAEGFDQFVPAPITTIHLWYDRDVTGLDHAVLLDTRIQWVFVKSRIRRWPVERGSYQELVISASWPELEMGREEILSSAIAEFETFFPAAREANLLKTGVLKEARATFSVTPGLDRFRPQQATKWKGLYVAGDWTATEWPSTMEGAVRSGRFAAGAVVGDRLRFMAAELPATGLMKLF
jgi:squalene-associated FAD-dependent desaturase